VALISVKVRQHSQMRAAPVDSEGNSTLPTGLNVGHRDEWKKEMGKLTIILAVQGARAVNGLHLTDGDWAGRASAELVSPPVVAGDAADGDGGDFNDGADGAPADDGDGDAGDDGGHGRHDGAIAGAGGDGDGDGGDNGGDDGAADDWMAVINEALHPGDDEEPPEGDDGEEELAAGGEDLDEEPPKTNQADQESEARWLKDAHAERRRRALARTAEKLHLRASQRAVQRATQEDDGGDGADDE